MAAEGPADRYAAHRALASIGAAGHENIRAARVLLVGLGGLGCPAAWYLAGSGIRALHLCDFDTVSESNLARQLLYAPADVGRPKCKAAAETLDRVNPDVALFSHDARVDEAFLDIRGGDCDLVIDASDNYGTRLAINRWSQNRSKPWIMGSCARMEGQLMFFDPRDGASPCYRCAYGSAPETLEDCSGAGVFAPVAGMVGTAMAHFALLFLAGLRPPDGLHALDAGAMRWNRLRVDRDPGCRDCGSGRAEPR